MKFKICLLFLLITAPILSTNEPDTTRRLNLKQLLHRRDAIIRQDKPGAPDELEINQYTPYRSSHSTKLKSISLQKKETFKRDDSVSAFVKSDSGYNGYEEIIPIRTKLLVKLCDDISNLNYSQAVMAEVVQDFNNIGIKHATLLGDFRVFKQKNNRVYIQFKSLVFPNGQEQSISAYGVDISDGKPGVVGVVDNKVGNTLLKTIGETATAVIAATTYQSTYGLTGRILEGVTNKPLENLETEALVQIDKNSRFYVMFDRPAKIEVYE